jgi:hypothetical protein
VTAVNRITGDPEYLQRSRTNALHYARANFNWQVVSPPLYRLYAVAPGKPN